MSHVKARMWSFSGLWAVTVDVLLWAEAVIDSEGLVRAVAPQRPAHASPVHPIDLKLNMKPSLIQNWHINENYYTNASVLLVNIIPCGFP